MQSRRLFFGLALLVAAAASAWSPRPALRHPPAAAPPSHEPLRPPLISPCRTSTPLLAASTGSGKVALQVDLGDDGEPKGTCRLLFNPLLARSELLVLDDLRVPLGMVIEEMDDGTIVAKGALPGYSANGFVEDGDLIRAVTAYRKVVADAPMWQQMMSYTPVGKMALKRLIFRTEGARYDDVREAIASHSEDEGGNGKVTLVIERAVNATTLPTPRDAAPAALEPLQEVIKKDLARKPVTKGIEEELEAMTPQERAQRLFDLGFDVPPPGSDE